jgi:hypothetical protein
LGGGGVPIGNSAGLDVLTCGIAIVYPGRRLLCCMQNCEPANCNIPPWSLPGCFWYANEHPPHALHNIPRVRIPADQLAIQCGECLQIVTGGLLVATPHAVRSSESPEGLEVQWTLDE